MEELASTGELGSSSTATCWDLAWTRRCRSRSGRCWRPPTPATSSWDCLAVVTPEAVDGCMHVRGVPPSPSADAARLYAMVEWIDAARRRADHATRPTATGSQQVDAADEHWSGDRLGGSDPRPDRTAPGHVRDARSSTAGSRRGRDRGPRRRLVHVAGDRRPGRRSAQRPDRMHRCTPTSFEGPSPAAHRPATDRTTSTASPGPPRHRRRPRRLLDVVLRIGTCRRRSSGVRAGAGRRGCARAIGRSARASSLDRRPAAGTARGTPARGRRRRRRAPAAPGAAHPRAPATG